MEYYKRTYGYWDDEEESGYLKKSFSNSMYMILLVDNKEIGCLALKEDQNSIFIDEIQILPSLQNKGIGSKILNDLVCRAKNEHKDVNLEVLKTNQRALSFYKRNGFSITEESETHFHLINSDHK